MLIYILIAFIGLLVVWPLLAKIFSMPKSIKYDNKAKNHISLLTFILTLILISVTIFGLNAQSNKNKFEFGKITKNLEKIISNINKKPKSIKENNENKTEKTDESNQEFNRRVKTTELKSLMEEIKDKENELILINEEIFQLILDKNKEFNEGEVVTINAGVDVKVTKKDVKMKIIDRY